MGTHIKRVHGLTIDEYRKQFPNRLVICERSSKRYGDGNIKRPSWRLDWSKEDLVAHDKRRGEKVSQAIMANPEERKRRSENMLQLLDTVLATPENRALLSEAAKKTSARPEILEQRSQQLAKWRQEHPDDFKEKCTDKMLAAKPEKPTWFSKPEKMLYAFVQTLPGFNFRFNQVVKSGSFDWQSQRKQVDIADKSKGIFVEFDGPFHFKLFSEASREKLIEVQRRDRLLDGYMIDKGLVLIRVSYDQFHDSRIEGKAYFKQECLDKLQSILETNQPGVYKIGDKYNEQYSEYNTDQQRTDIRS